MSLKQEIIGGRDQFRVLLRTVSYTLHGLVPASSICADRYDREAVVRAFSNEAGLKPSLTLGQLPTTSDELLKLDQVFVKSELKVGVLYVKHGQTTEEQILANKDESPAFKEFLSILGDKVRLKGFDKYKGGLDTVHDLTGKESVYTCYRGIEIMFHVSTLLPHEENDPQKLQKKRHIGNDIVSIKLTNFLRPVEHLKLIARFFIGRFVWHSLSRIPHRSGQVLRVTFYMHLLWLERVQQIRIVLVHSLVNITFRWFAETRLVHSNRTCGMRVRLRMVHDSGNGY